MHKKYQIKESKTKSGNALLIAILLTSILILITLGLARLITSESRQISDLIRNGQAEYLAESGAELGQLLFYSTESSYKGGLYNFKTELNNQEASIQYLVETTTNHLPILPKDYFENAKNNQTNETKFLLFQKILPGESIEIPLVENSTFEIEYFLPNLSNDSLGNFTQADLNILLYKLSGERKNLITDSESFKIDFLTAYLPAGGSDTCPNPSSIGKSPTNPAKIISTNSQTNCYFNGGDYFEYSDGEIDETSNPIFDNGQITSVKEYQTKQMLNSVFLSEHDNNIITLTNAINLNQINLPNSFNDPQKVEELLGSIYFRVCSPNCISAEREFTEPNQSNSNTENSKNIIAPFVSINSTATYANTTKNLITTITRPNALSVFDFAIFRTATN